jgi:tripartite-type tricarboxylate transporter receptor subunit TctC
MKNASTVMLAVVFALAAVNSIAKEVWPTKPIRLITAAPAGMAPDIIARLVMDRVSQSIGQTIIHDYHPAANGVVAMQRAAASAADGYTFVYLHTAAAVVTPSTFKQAKYDVERDVEAIAAVANTPLLIVANNDVAARTLADMIEMAKKAPGMVVVGNPVRTSIPHLAAELIGQRAGAEFNHVWFNSSPMGVQATIKGDAQFFIDGPAVLLPMVKSGRLRAIAVTAPSILPGLEGIPLAKDTVPEASVLGWFVTFALPGTPQPIKQRMNDEINKALRTPEVAARLHELGTYPMPGSIADAQKFVRNEKKRWAEVIRNAAIQAE